MLKGQVSSAQPFALRGLVGHVAEPLPMIVQRQINEMAGSRKCSRRIRQAREGNLIFPRKREETMKGKRSFTVLSACLMLALLTCSTGLTPERARAGDRQGAMPDATSQPASLPQDRLVVFEGFMRPV